MPYSISPAPASISENAGVFTFTVFRSGVSGASTVYVSTVTDQGYANNGAYSGLVNQQVTFASGQTSAQVSVSIHDLGLTSGSETYRLIVQQNASDPVSTSLASDTFTILNNDAPPSSTYSISPSPASISENAGQFTFTIFRSGGLSASDTVFVSTVTDQGFSNNGIYSGLVNQLISFSPGQTSAQVSLSIHDLGLTSGSESYRLIVQHHSTDPVSTYLASDTFTILNNDAAPSSGSSYSLSPSPATVNENAGALTFTVTRSGGTSSGATVFVSTVTDQGFANSGAYTGLANQTLSFSPGQTTAQITLSIHDLGLTSGSESYRLIVQQSATDPVSTSLASDTFTIRNTDAPVGSAGYAIGGATVIREDSGASTFTITRSGPTASSATVYVSTVTDQGFANNGAYTGIANQAVTFAAGQTTAQVSLSIHDLGLTSGSESYRLIVQQSPSDPISTSLASQTFSIVNNDAPVVVAATYAISPAAPSISESAGSITFTVSRLGSTTAAATVYASTVTDQGFANSGAYTGIVNQAVSFAAGQTTAQVTLSVHDLGLTSGSERYRLIIQQNAADPASIWLASDTFTILNNDTPSASNSTFAIDPAPASISENAGVFTFTVSRTGASTPATVYVSTVADQGSANAGNYTGVVNQQITFAAGQTTAHLNLAIHDLGLTSGSEHYRLIVQQNPTDPVSVSLASDAFTILNNDSADTAALVSIAGAPSQPTAKTLVSTVANAPIGSMLGTADFVAGRVDLVAGLATDALVASGKIAKESLGTKVAAATGVVASAVGVANGAYELVNGVKTGSSQQAVNGLLDVASNIGGLVPGGQLAGLASATAVVHNTLDVRDALSSHDALTIATALDNAVVVGSCGLIGFLAAGGILDPAAGLKGADEGVSVGQTLFDDSQKLGDAIGNSAALSNFIAAVPQLQSAYQKGGPSGLFSQATTDLVSALPDSVRSKFSIIVGHLGGQHIAGDATGSGSDQGPIVIQVTNSFDGLTAAINLVSKLLIGSTGELAIHLQSEFSTLLRTADTLDHVDVSVQQILAGSATEADYVGDAVRSAAATTSVATLAYQFFTGSTPSEAGMDYLVSPTGPNPNNINSAYYAGFDLENRYINFAVNLGKTAGDRSSFAPFSLLSLSAATRLAYLDIFGSSPSNDKVSTLLNASVTSDGHTMTRADYFALYGADGLDGIGTKAAMVGWLLAEAVKADVGVYALSNDAYLKDVATGAATFGIDMVGHYNSLPFIYVGG